MLTDAEVAEIKNKAEDVLNKAMHGAKFAYLAKQYSEDTTKDKGGDLGWIVRGLFDGLDDPRKAERTRSPGLRPVQRIFHDAWHHFAVLSDDCFARLAFGRTV